MERYKQYLASNFYEDNIGEVELISGEGHIVKNTF